jgi:DNA repair ATPase RecN
MMIERRLAEVEARYGADAARMQREYFEAQQRTQMIESELMRRERERAEAAQTMSILETQVRELSNRQPEVVEVVHHTHTNTHTVEPMVVEHNTRTVVHDPYLVY